MAKCLELSFSYIDNNNEKQTKILVGTTPISEGIVITDDTISDILMNAYDEPNHEWHEDVLDIVNRGVSVNYIIKEQEPPVKLKPSGINIGNHLVSNYTVESFGIRLRDLAPVMKDVQGYSLLIDNLRNVYRLNDMTVNKLKIVAVPLPIDTINKTLNKDATGRTHYDTATNSLYISLVDNLGLDNGLSNDLINDLNNSLIDYFITNSFDTKAFDSFVDATERSIDVSVKGANNKETALNIVKHVSSMDAEDINADLKSKVLDFLINTLRVKNENLRNFINSLTRPTKAQLSAPIQVNKSNSTKALYSKPVFSNIGINTLRKLDTNENFGNPFSGSNAKNAISVGLNDGSKDSVEYASKLYKQWLYGGPIQDSDLASKLNVETFEEVEPDRRNWILGQIQNLDSDLYKVIAKGGTLNYMSKTIDGEYYYSHADALSEIIYEYNNPKGQRRTNILSAIITTNKQLNLFNESQDPKYKEFNKLPARSAMPTMFYAGIGSRQTPPDVQQLMTEIAKDLQSKGFTLRTGDAKGADSAFAQGAGPYSEIYRANNGTQRTRDIAREIHPSPQSLDAMRNSQYVWNLMARNTNQIFGEELDTPVDFVLAWTQDGATHYSNRSIATGGTGQAIELASRKGIPVINLANPQWQEQLTQVLNEISEAINPEISNEDEITDSRTIVQLVDTILADGVGTLEEAAAIYLAGNNSKPGKIRPEDLTRISGLSGRDLEPYSQFLSKDAPRIDQIQLFEGIDQERANAEDSQETAQVLVNFLLENAGNVDKSSPVAVRKRMLLKFIQNKVQDYYRDPAATIKQPSSYKPTADIPDTQEAIKKQAPKDTNRMSKAMDSFKNSKPTDSVRLNALTDKLSQTYGLDIEIMTSSEIAEAYDSRDTNYTRAIHRAFIDENNKIIINIDYATLAEPIHELGHFVLDGLKITNRTLYNTILNVIKTHPEYTKISKYYPELSETETAEEVFVTVMGEHFNGTQLSNKNQNWKEENIGFFAKVIRAIKNWFSDLFGIDSYKFHDLTGTELLNMSFNDIFDSFSTDILNGSFMSEVELGTSKTLALQNDSYLKNNAGEESSLYQNLLSKGIDPNIASDVWIKTKNRNFVNWQQDSLAVSEDGEPKLFYRTDDPTIVSETDIHGRGDLVFVKGTLIPEGENFKVLSSNVKSIYNAGGNNEVVTYKYNVDDFANSNGYKTIGSSAEVNYTISKLKPVFENLAFSMNSVNDVFFLQYYKKPSNEVEELRKKLFQKNLIQSIC